MGDRETKEGYAAWPDDAGPFPAIVLIPDVRGLTDHYRDVARRFASEGFYTFAIDLYHREEAPELPDMNAVNRWISALPDRRVLGDIQEAVESLARRDDIRPESIGVTGYCMGGQYALLAACSVSGLTACVSWYGMIRYPEINETKPASPLDLAPQLACPYLGLFGEEDPIIPLADVDELKTILTKNGKNCTIKTYPNAGHAFFNDGRPEMYRPEAAKDAWPRAVGFFRKFLTLAFIVAFATLGITPGALANERYDKLDVEDHSGYHTEYLFGMTKGVVRSTLAPALKPVALVFTLPLDVALLPFAAVGGFFR